MYRTASGTTHSPNHHLLPLDHIVVIAKVKVSLESHLMASTHDVKARQIHVTLLSTD